MKNLRRALIILLLLVFVLSSISAFACTIFTKSDDELVLVGNNEDWRYSYDSMYWVVPANEREYARICFGISRYVQGGMNEKGLFYDGATCPDTEIPYESNKKTLGIDMGETILSTCANVDEAVEFLENYNISTSFGDHILFADSSGKAVVVEWIDREMRVIPAENNQQIATNFFLSNPDLGGFPCERYQTVNERLSEPDSLNLLEFSNILFSTAQDWGDGGTKYSNIYDLKSLTVYVYEKADYSRIAIINLSDELKKADDKIMDNISNLTYHETASILGGTVENYQKTEDTSIVQESDSGEQPAEQSTNAKNNNYYFGIVIIAVISFIFLLVILTKNKRHKRVE